jgi:hypothetical protein
MPIVLTGTNLAAAALVITGPDVRVSDVATPNDTTLTAIVTIADTATPSTEARLLIVTTESGQATIEFFVVPADTPTVTSIRPGAGEPGDTVPVTLKGLNLTGATVSDSSGNITLLNAMVVDDETITFDVAIFAGATTNVNHTLTLSPGGSTTVFRVIPAGTPFFNAARPPFGNRGSVVTVRFDGVNLDTVVPGTGVQITGGGITVSNALTLDEHLAQATFAIDPAANIGASRDVSITNDAGTFTVADPFRVNISGPIPTITDVTPTLVEHGTTTPMSVTGSNFTGGAVLVTGSGATVSNVVVDPTSTLITFDLTLAGDAPAQSRGVIVVTENGTAQFNIASVGSPTSTTTSLPPGPPTSTTTTLPPGPPTSTTTTLPPCSLCDDGDPCTADVCASSLCVHHEATGPEAVTCAYSRSFACAGALVPSRVTLAWARARALTTTALQGGQPTAKRLLKRSDLLLAKAMRRLSRLARRRSDLMPADCAVHLQAILADASARLAICLATRCFAPSTTTTLPTASTATTLSPSE